MLKTIQWPARRVLKKGHTISLQIEDRIALADNLLFSGLIAQWAGRNQQAIEKIREAAKIHEEMGALFELEIDYTALAHSLIHMGNFDGARNRLVNTKDIGDYRLDVKSPQVIVGATAHPPGDKHLAVADSLRHTGVPGGRPAAAAVLPAVNLVVVTAPAVVLGLLPRFPTGNLTIFYRQHQIERRPPEVLADSFPVLGYYRDFHACTSFWKPQPPPPRSCRPRFSPPCR